MNVRTRNLVIIFGVLAFMSFLGYLTNLNEPAVTPTNQPQVKSIPRMMPEVASFLAEHGDLGSAREVEEMPDWARGPRQVVIFDKGYRLLFYIESGKVVSVWDRTEGHEAKIIWGKTSEY